MTQKKTLAVIFVFSFPILLLFQNCSQDTGFTTTTSQVPFDDSVAGQGDQGLAAPGIVINSGAQATNRSTVSLGIETPEVASEIYLTEDAECSNNGIWEPVIASKSYDLKQENTEVAVYLKYRTESGAESSCSSDSIVHDNIAPSLQMIPPSPITNNTTVGVNYFVEDLNGVAFVECSLNGSLFQQCDIDQTEVETLENLGNHGHNFQIRATDNAGNVSPYGAVEFLVDSIPPVINITSRPPSLSPLEDSIVQFTVTDPGLGSDINTVMCSYDGQAPVDCDSGQFPVENMAPGAHQLQIIATDLAGNSTTETPSWVINRNAPTISIVDRPTTPSTVTNDTTRFTATDNNYGIKSTQCFLNGAAMANCPINTPIALQNLPQGPNSFRVVVTNQADLTAEDTANWFVDSIAPQATVTEGPEAVSTETTGIFEYQASDSGSGVSSVQCYLDNQPTPCPFANGNGMLTLQNLDVGDHAFHVVATDNAGIQGPSNVHRFTVAPPIRYCNDPEFRDIPGDCIALRDSFERSGLNVANAMNGFGWETAFYDNFGGGSTSLDVVIRSKGFNPVSIIQEELDAQTDMRRGLWFTARDGASVHEMLLFTKPMNLENYQALKLSYDYLAVDMEYADQYNGRGAFGDEGVQVEYCTGSAAQCLQNPTGGNTSAGPVWEHWQLIPGSASARNAGDGLNGTNHIDEDWMTKDVTIDLSALPAATRQNFRFRFRVLMTDGFINGGPQVKDAVAIDNVKAVAIQNP